MSTAAQNQHHAAEAANQQEQERNQRSFRHIGVFYCDCGWRMMPNRDHSHTTTRCGNPDCPNCGVLWELPRVTLTRAKEQRP